MKREIIWRLTETQKALIMRAVLHCPTQIGEGAEELEEYWAHSKALELELEQLGHGGEGLWWYLHHNTKRRKKR